MTVSTEGKPVGGLVAEVVGVHNTGGARRSGRPHARDTSERVLAAAGELFASKGYRDTTVREIKERAEANIAAVNYHFSNKENLHREALRRAFAYTRDSVLIPTFADPEQSPEQRLQIFVRASLESLLSADRPAWHLPLVMRELADPTDNFRQVVREMGMPFLARMEQVFAQLLPTGSAPSMLQLRLLVLSVCGQCCYYRHAKPLVLELLQLPDYDASWLATFATHITNFTLSALRCGMPTLPLPNHEPATPEPPQNPR